jgi:hypothetical protein
MKKTQDEWAVKKAMMHAQKPNQKRSPRTRKTTTTLAKYCKSQTKAKQNRME